MFPAIEVHSFSYIHSRFTGRRCIKHVESTWNKKVLCPAFDDGKIIVVLLIRLLSHLIIIIIFIDKIQVIIIMVKLNIAMYSVIRAESAMTIRPLQYAL